MLDYLGAACFLVLEHNRILAFELSALKFPLFPACLLLHLASTFVEPTFAPFQLAFASLLFRLTSASTFAVVSMGDHSRFVLESIDIIGNVFLIFRMLVGFVKRLL